MTVLLCEEQGFLLHRQASVDLTQNRQILTAVAQDTRFNGVLAVRYIIPAIAEADLRLVRRMDDVQKFERAENFLHVYSSKETEESYTVRCSIIQPGQQSLFDNEHTVYETVKVGEADGVLGTSTDEHGKNVYTLSWEHRGITHTVMGNIPYDEIMKIAEGIR